MGPERLLDSYERERRPIAAETLRQTDINFRYETSCSFWANTARSGNAVNAVSRVCKRALLITLPVLSLAMLDGRSFATPAHWSPYSRNRDSRSKEVITQNA